MELSKELAIDSYGTIKACERMLREVHRTVDFLEKIIGVLIITNIATCIWIAFYWEAVLSRP